MTTINTYLNFNGNCEEAFLFYKAAFGGEFNYIGRYSDMPQNTEHPLPDSQLNNIMHISLPIGNTILLGSDAGGEWAQNIKIGNNFTVSINTDSKKEADRLFGALSKDGIITMPMNETFWGSYFGMFTDKFQIQWMISFAINTKEK